MLKKALIGTGAAAALGTFVFGTSALSYMETGVHEVREAVRAGKPVEIIFENQDLMPHNFVLVQPGALEEVGLLGEKTATEPGAAQREYVPPSDKILFSSRLLQPRDAQRLRFTAPAKPGVYPYVCTYPGHWRRMYGALYVVEDLEGYLAEACRFLTPADYEYLFDSIRLLTFELGVRFFTDYLAGNVYFKVRDPEHNLRRALVQFRLTQSIEAHETDIRHIIQRMVSRAV